MTILNGVIASAASSLAGQEKAAFRGFRIDPGTGEVAFDITARAPTDSISQSRVLGDKFPRFTVAANGSMAFGNGTIVPTRLTIVPNVVVAGADERLEVTADQLSLFGILSFSGNGTIQREASTGDLVISPQAQIRLNSQVVGANAAAVPLTVRGKASQTGNLQNWQDSAAAILFSIDANGFPKWIAGKEQTTVGAAGGASALPITPTKFLQVKDSGGTTLVIPAYAAA